MKTSIRLSIAAIFFLAPVLSHAQLAITKVNSLPAGLVSNSYDSANAGATLVDAANSKGQTFTLASESNLTSITVRLDAVTDGTGSFSVAIYNLAGTVPTGTALLSASGTLPSGMAAGDYLQFSFASALNLAAGSYGFVFTSTDASLTFTLSKDNAYGGLLLRKNSSSSNIWDNGTDPNIDFVFALAGPSVGGPAVLASPAGWPAGAFKENPPQGSAAFVRVDGATKIGQSFELTGNALVDSVVLQIDDTEPLADADGVLTLELFGLVNGLPSGSPVASVTGSLPGGLAPGSLLRFNFPTSVLLTQGSHALVLSTSNADLCFNATAGDVLPAGELLVNGGTWAAATPAGRDLVFGLHGTLFPPPSGKPNILVILADDFSWTDIQSGNPNLGNGSDYYQTPHLNRLAAEGLSFTSAYVQPNCAPTRAALLSGQYASRSGNGCYNVLDLNRGTGSPTLTGPSQNEDVPAAHYTVAEMLRDAGYVTCHVGKYHVGGHEGGTATLPENQGFDFNYGGNSSGRPASFFANSSGIFSDPSPTINVFGAPYNTTYINSILVPYQNGNNASSLNGTNKHLTDAEGDAALEFMANHLAGAMSGSPFYLQYHSYAVHTPIQSRSDLQTKYQNLTKGTRHKNAAYAALVEGLDMSVGRILDFLDDPNGDGNKSDSIAGNTLVVFLSDNGGNEGDTDNAPLRSCKGTFYEGGIRVPMIVRQPGLVPANQTTNTLFHAVDLFPTLMEAAGGSTPKILDGTSFYQHTINPIANPRNRAPVCYHFPGYLDERARPCSVIIKDVAGKRFKLIYNYDFKYDPTPADDAIKVLSQPWELYNITDDLSETKNLVTGNYWDGVVYGGIINDMAADLNAWLTQNDPTWNAKQPTSGGVPVPYAPATVAPVTVPFENSFRIKTADINHAGGQLTITFSSSQDYLYDIEASSDLGTSSPWSRVATGISGQPGQTTVVIDDAGTTNSPSRFYRAVVRAW